MNFREKTKVVFFDVGNTLLLPAKPEEETVSELLGGFGLQVNPEIIKTKVPLMYQYYEQQYHNDNSVWADEERVTELWRQMYLRLCELLEIPDDLHLDFAEAVLAHYLKPDSWATFQDVLPILEFLADQGIKMGLISNWDCSLRSIITGMGLDHFFNCAIASAEVQSYKPNDRIFLMALEQLKAKPWQAYHIGDHETADVQGARAVGITPVYLNREGHKLDETASIKSLLELPEIIF